MKKSTLLLTVLLILSGVFSLSAYAASESGTVTSSDRTADEMLFRFAEWLYEKDGRSEEFDPEADPQRIGGQGGFEVLHTASDWALIYADLCAAVPWQTEYNLGLCGRVIPGNTGADDESSAYPYYIYEKQSDSYRNIYLVAPSDACYEELGKALDALKIGRPIGDSDGDGRLTILDATHIQRALAGLTVIEESADSYSIGGMSGRRRRYSDANGDGEVTILDATAIQRRLAGLASFPVGR